MAPRFPSTFEVADYIVLLGTIALSSAAGIYYGAIKKKNDSVEEYFLASRDLSVFKMSCSIFATVLSSGALVGLVAEIYYYGSQLMLGGVFGGILSRVICNIFFFPVFFAVGSYDVYKYYEIRFNKPIRYLLSTLTVIEMIFIDSVILYGTSSALSKATNLNLWLIIVILTSTCALYSAFGGVRGVTIADMIQGFVIIISVLMVFILGLIHIGGFSITWERNVAGGRIEFFNFDVNPKTRHTVWTACVAHVINLTAIISTSQTSLMRLMATKDIKKSIRASYIASVLIAAVYFLCGCLGLLIYATYYLCDPKTNGTIKSPNQLISSFVGYALRDYCGLRGLFFSALVCAAISTLSSHLNALSALSMTTFIKPFNLIKSDRCFTIAAKIATIIGATLALICTVVVQKFPNVFQASIVLSSVTNGPHFALLIIGVLFPKSNLRSSIGGFGFGVLFMLWVLIGSLILTSPNITKPVSISGCPSKVNSSLITDFPLSFTNATLTSDSVTTSTSIDTEWESYFPISTASHNWFTTVGVLITLIAFAILSLFYGADKDRKINPNLVPNSIQAFHKKLGKKWKTILLCDIYNDDTKISEEMNVIQTEKLMS